MTGDTLFFAAAGFAFGWFVVGPVVSEWVRAWRRRRWEREENRRRALAWQDYWPHVAPLPGDAVLPFTPGESVEPAPGGKHDVKHSTERLLAEIRRKVEAGIDARPKSRASKLAAKSRAARKARSFTKQRAQREQER